MSLRAALWRSNPYFVGDPIEKDYPFNLGLLRRKEQEHPSRNAMMNLCNPQVTAG